MIDFTSIMMITKVPCICIHACHAISCNACDACNAGECIHICLPTYLPTYLHTYIHTYSTVQYSTVQYSPVHCIALHCIALHCIALHCITLHYITLHTYIHRSMCIWVCSWKHLGRSYGMYIVGTTLLQTNIYDVGTPSVCRALFEGRNEVSTSMLSIYHRLTGYIPKGLTY